MTLRPAYSENFRCIGTDCEDTCCQGWSVPIDEATHQRYYGLPESPLRTLIVDNLVRIEATPDQPAAAGAKAAVFAKIRMDSANQCPLLSEERLCRIQQTYGEALLSHTCATYPRVVSTVAGGEEKALTLSCPEAARLVLLNPRLLSLGVNQSSPDAPSSRLFSGERVGSPESHSATPIPASPAIMRWFHPIRDAAIAMVLNRAYPLWQRMFLLSIFCRRIDTMNAPDAAAQAELPQALPAFLSDFESTVGSGSLRAAMEVLPVDRQAQLDAVLRLAGMLLHRSNVRPRFVECVQAFTAGIGNGPGATIESLTAHYTVAHDRYFEPFFARHPYMLENYLINTIFRCQFPFGREVVKGEAQASLSREFAMLTAQFTLIKGLLIGVAGFHREAFSDAHIVHTVQAASKHFEHHPEFLTMAHALLVESQLDGARGTAILLRNTEPAPPVPTETPAIQTPAGLPSPAQQPRATETFVAGRS